MIIKDKNERENSIKFDKDRKQTTDKEVVISKLKQNYGEGMYNSDHLDDTVLKELEFNLFLMFYDQTIEEQLTNILRKINSIKNQSTNFKLLTPEVPKVQMVLTNKMFVMPISEKPISLQWLLRQKSYQFSPNQIIDAAISGITSLSQLHSLNIVHGKISPSTCYFYNRDHRVINKSSAKTEILTYFSVCVIDASCYVVKKIANANKIKDMIYEPCSNSLGLGITFKDDIQSLLYVLIKMATGDKIFNLQRLESNWQTQQQIRRWKLNQLYREMIDHIPEKLEVLIQFYLHLQQLCLSDKVDYSYFIRRLWKEKQTLFTQEGEQIGTVEMDLEEQKSVQSEVFLTFQNEGQHDYSDQQIFEEDIRIGVRATATGFEKLRDYPDF